MTLDGGFTPEEFDPERDKESAYHLRVAEYWANLARELRRRVGERDDRIRALVAELKARQDAEHRGRS